jgi:hypothetical protein
MNRRTSFAVRAVAMALLVFVLLPNISMACSVCYGNPDSPMTKGTNNAIVFLLGIVGVVQIGFIALFVAFWRRAREQRRRFRLLDGGTANLNSHL